MNNPLAFPHSHVLYNKGQPSYEDSDYYDGMTLRDYFAAKALQGYISNTEWMNQLAKTVGEEVEKVDAVNAVRSYAAADAMLQIRDKPSPHI